MSLGCLPVRGPALCRAILKASKSTGLPKAGERTIRAADTSGDVGTSMEYISTSSRGEVLGLCSAEKQELGLGLTHSLLPFLMGQFGEGTQVCPGRVFISRRP